MELWIRSQDRQKFYKANEIYAESEIEDYKETGIYYIRVNEEFFATYKSEKRALEVLDEIQNIIISKPILQAKSILPIEDMDKIGKKYDMKVIPSCVDVIEPISTSFVYEMPKE